MNGNTREKIFKSWTGISEINLIKEVATKGEHIELCIEYWARKRKMDIDSYRLFFYDVVQNYVQRLLTERLVCKAEMVLRNAQHDVCCCYYQFACESEDEELREMIITHLRKKEVKEEGMLELRNNWELLSMIQSQPELLAKCKAKMPKRRINLEAMFCMDLNFRKRLIVELYFLTRNDELLPQLNKHATWDYLVELQEIEQLLQWFTCANSTDPFDQLYASWLPIEPEMYEYALKTLKEPDDVLRNCFVSAGYFFADEISNVGKILNRICTTQSFEVNREFLKKLPFARFLFERKEYMLLLRPFVSVRELEELTDCFREHRRLFELVISLRNHDLETREGFEKISYATKVYLQNSPLKTQCDSLATADEEPLVAFYEFLCYEPTMADLNCCLHSGSLQRIPYLTALSARMSLAQNETSNTNTNTNDNKNKSGSSSKPAKLGPYELLKKFTKLDFTKLSNDLELDEIASFSNPQLCDRYARRYQLNFLHYLQQHRSAYAVYYLIISHLQSYAQITRPQLFSACETVTEMALQHADNAELVAHCMAFAEMLGFDTQPQRTLFRLWQLFEKSNSAEISEMCETTEITSNCISSCHFLIDEVEKLLLKNLQAVEKDCHAISAFPLAEYQALMRLVNCNQQREWPTLVLQHYAGQNNWWRLLILMQYFEIPLREIRRLVTSFETRQIGEHLLRALSYEAVPPPGSYERANSGSGSGSSKQRHTNSTATRHRKGLNHETGPQITTSHETMTSSLSSCNDNSGNSSTLTQKSIDQAQQMRFLATLDQIITTDRTAASELDLFAIILLSTTSANEEPFNICVSKFLEIMQDTQTQYATSWNLLRNCVKYRLPVLAILAATINANNVDWQWLVWISVNTDQWSELLQHAIHAKTDASDIGWLIIESAVERGHIASVYRSFCIFYGQQYPLTSLFGFLHLTQNGRDFGEKAVHELSLYLLAWSNDEVKLPLEHTSFDIVQSPRRSQLLQRTLKLFLKHLQQNFDSILAQQRFLSCICQSGITDLYAGRIDFCLLNEIFGIIQSNIATSTCNNEITQLPFDIDFEQLLQEEDVEHAEFKRLLFALLEAHSYDVAIRLATLLNMPICDIVYAKWVASLDNANDYNHEQHTILFATYESEVVKHSLPPEVLVNFFLYAASRLETTAARRKYVLLQNALNVIKKHLLFPNESFDRDQIEYNMIICYLQIDDTEKADETDDIDELPIYHSEYYEQIMIKERCVLYKSFLELKELAGIDDLNVGSLKTTLTDAMQERLEELLHRLLDEGDIVEALRLQELFECRPLDLRFIVFCMALAEGVTKIFSMSTEERQLLRDIEKSAFSKFNKRTLDTISGSGSQHSQPLHSASPMRDEFSESCSTLEFEEIPSKEKRETLEMIQGIASRLKHGIDLGKRIVLSYRAAMYLDKEYLDVLRTKDANILLRSVAEEGCLRRLLVVSDIMTSTHMTPEEIADLLAHEITTAIIRPRFYIFRTDQQTKNYLKNADLWGYNIDRDLHLFLELAPSTTKLGNCLLEYCDALKSYRKFQDNKPYEHSAIFEKLAEIIRVYGLPTSAAAVTTSSTTLPTATTIPTTTTTPTNLPTLGMHIVSSSILSGAASTVSAVVTGGNIANGISSPHPPQVLSHKKQNLIYVELLIKAYQCFVHECSMEGIANVLNRAKSLNAVLSNAKSWSLIVRMLIGIARYREMFYCFDALIENEQFESLLGQFDEDKTIGLRQAILAYLREYEPVNSREFLKLAALHFLMYKDLAEMWEQDAQKLLADVLNIGSITINAQALGSSITEQTSITHLRCTTEIIHLLQMALQNYTHATENYLLDNKLLLAQKSASMAEVIAMQIDFVNKASSGNGVSISTLPINCCVCVLNVLTFDEFRELVNVELSVPQALILSRGYGYDINWVEALLSQYVLLMRKSYLAEFLALLTINDGIIENVVKSYQRYTQNNQKSNSQMEEHLSHMVTLVRSVVLRYKLASLLSMKSFVMSALNDPTVHYLKDTNYGRNENHNMPDI